MSASDDEEETHCPLCVEEMDLSDRNFLPCPCGYRVSHIEKMIKDILLSPLTSFSVNHALLGTFVKRR
jgi:hypothetical protein